MKVCIVGNSNRILEGEFGEFIDSCDVVIRMNRFSIEDTLSKHVGKKIDIISIRATGEGVSKELADHIPKEYFDICTEIWIPVIKDFYTTPTENRFFDLRKDVSKNKARFATKNEYYSIVNNVVLETGSFVSDAWDENFLTTGYLTIELAITRYPTASIYIVGFDPLQKKNYTHYWLPEIIPQHDHLNLEAKMILKKIKDGKVISLMEI